MYIASVEPGPKRKRWALPVSIAAVVQKERREGAAVPIVVMTHECERRAVYAAVAEIDRSEGVAQGTVVLHAEHLAA